MRQSATSSPLRVLIKALPDEALRPLLLALLENGTSSSLPLTTPPATEEPPLRRAYRCRAGSRPPGRRRGPGRPLKADAEMEAKQAARRARNAERAREKRAALKAERQANGNGGNGREETKAPHHRHGVLGARRRAAAESPLARRGQGIRAE
jgi:hypothetical protein